MILATLKIPDNHSLSLTRITQYTCFLLLFILPLLASGQSSRWEQDLSGPGWELYLDKNAEWENDELYLPPVDLDAVPVNPPTGGWDNLSEVPKKSVSVPGTVEGYYWSVTDSTGEMSGDYIGVSWWSRTFEVPSDLEGKRLMLAFESVNLRAEVFINQKLVGYDIIGNTPFDVDISDAVNVGGSNNLDIRITDIGGTFSWDDTRAIDWGGNKVPSVHGFGGITGDVLLYATDEVYVEDVYVQNQPDPKTVKVFVTLGNDTGSRQMGMYEADTIDTSHLLDLVKQGTRLIILENASSWINILPVEIIPEFENRSGRRNRNLNGRQFVGRNSLFEGLPQATAMSWEYQVFYRESGEGLPISPEGLETIVGVGPTNTGMIGIALSELLLGQGGITLSTLDIVSNLMNDRPDAAVAKKLFVNLLNTP